MEEFEGCNRFPNLLCVFHTDFVERKIRALLRVVRKYSILRFV